MGRAARILQQMKVNPRDWRIESLITVAEATGMDYRQPGGSHVIFRLVTGAMLSVPAHRPIKPVYIRKFVRFVEEGIPE